MSPQYYRYAVRCLDEFSELIETGTGRVAHDETGCKMDCLRTILLHLGRHVFYVAARAASAICEPYDNDIGPGVYDIHSPRVPTVDELEEKIKLLFQVLPPARLWINPDCGLKTRRWEEVEPALENMVRATEKMRLML